jgi:hypothetical protein
MSRRFVPTVFLLALFFFALSPILEAQVYERAFGLEVAPHAGGRRISAGAGVPFQQLEAQDSLENGVGGYGIGLIFESRADKIGFTTGVRYLKTGYEAMLESNEGPGLGRATLDEVSAQYVSIPFELNFHQDINEKDRVLFMLGMSANLHLKTTTKQTVFLDGEVQSSGNLPEDATQEFRPVVLSLNTGIGFDRKLGEDWAVRIQPYFRFFLQGNLKTNFDQLNRNYYQTGVRVTVKRVFL